MNNETSEKKPNLSDLVFVDELLPLPDSRGLHPLAKRLQDELDGVVEKTDKPNR